jgi:hypothetical protein
MANEIERRDLAIQVARARLEKLKADLVALRANPPKFLDANDYYRFWGRVEGMQKAIPVQEAEVKALELALAEYREKQAPRMQMGGTAAGRTDTVPALLTPGEYVVPRATVQRLGAGFFDALNRLALPAQAVAQRIQGFASGGWVAPSAAAPVRGGAWSGATATRTVRVELAGWKAGHRADRGAGRGAPPGTSGTRPRPGRLRHPRAIAEPRNRGHARAPRRSSLAR